MPDLRPPRQHDHDRLPLDPLPFAVERWPGLFGAFDTLARAANALVARDVYDAVLRRHDGRGTIMLRQGCRVIADSGRG